MNDPSPSPLHREERQNRKDRWDGDLEVKGTGILLSWRWEELTAISVAHDSSRVRRDSSAVVRDGGDVIVDGGQERQPVKGGRLRTDTGGLWSGR